MSNRQNTGETDLQRRDLLKAAGIAIIGGLAASATAAPIEANSNGITEGQSSGWRLIYCKGSEGEQLEFVQALGPVKGIFDSAHEARQIAVGR